MENVENVEGKCKPVEMPGPVVDYWMEKALTHNRERPMKCSYCDEPIEKGDRYFYLVAVNSEPSTRIFVADRGGFIMVSKVGHVTHLVEAPPRDWVFSPEKQRPQPWEEHPEQYEAPPGWEEWKQRNRGVNYG